MNTRRIWDGSVGRAPDKRFDDPRFEPLQKHKKNL